MSQSGFSRDYPDYWHPIRWVAQDEEVRPSREWFSAKGYLKHIRVKATLAAGKSYSEIVYSIPAEQWIWCNDVWMLGTVKGYYGIAAYPPEEYATYIAEALLQGYATFERYLSTPLIFPGGWWIYFLMTNMDTASGDLIMALTLINPFGASIKLSEAGDPFDYFRRGDWVYANIERREDSTIKVILSNPRTRTGIEFECRGSLWRGDELLRVIKEHKGG